MQTKLALTLAVSRRPELLILDEPGDGLDPVAIEMMLESVVKGSGGRRRRVLLDSPNRRYRTGGGSRFHHESRIARIRGCLEQLRESCRRVNLVFPGPAPAQEMSVERVRKIWADGHRLSLLPERNLEAIAGKAHSLGALSIEVQSVNLRGWFLESVAADEGRRDLVQDLC
jgi:ABC-2 type transport system ATP-binding protein